jgi:hypothetical protein
MKILEVFWKANKHVSKLDSNIFNLLKGKFYISPFFFLYLTLFNLPQILAADSVQMASHPQWLKLLRYQNRWYGGGLRGLADSNDFYLSPNGKNDPLAELQYHIQHINDEKSWVCDFPARYLFLKKHFPNLRNVDLIKDCKEFAFFHQNMNAERASVVFPSYFIANPGSTFGHILIRYHRKKDSQISDDQLRDYAFTYSALVPEGENAIIYSIKGLFGGYIGAFQSIPYFYKLREYNDMENRDLWTYDLNLTKEELELLIAHSFEMKNTHFNYFYFDENCGSHLLYLLDAINPKWEMTKKVNTFVLPIDMVKIMLEVPGLVSKTHYIPSKTNLFQYQLSLLTTQEKETFNHIVEKKFYVPNDINLGKNPEKVLDTAIEFFDLKYFKQLTKKQEEKLKIKHQLLSLRSQYPSYETPVLEAKNPPHTGHKTREFVFSSEYHQDLKSSFGLSYRFALHDLEDPPQGHAPLSSVEIMRIKANYFVSKESLKLTRVDALNILALTPISQFQFDKSFLVKGGLKREEDLDCSYCLRSYFQGGLGLTYEMFNVYTYALVLAEVQYSGGFVDDKFRISEGAKFGVIKYFDDINFHAFYTAMMHQLTEEDITGRFHFHFNFSNVNTYNFSIRYLVNQEGSKNISFNVENYF